jgi:hypothetical protein
MYLQSSTTIKKFLIIKELVEWIMIYLLIEYIVVLQKTIRLCDPPKILDVLWITGFSGK